MPKFRCYYCGLIKDHTGPCPKCGRPKRLNEFSDGRFKDNKPPKPNHDIPAIPIQEMREKNTSDVRIVQLTWGLVEFYCLATALVKPPSPLPAPTS